MAWTISKEERLDKALNAHCCAESDYYTLVDDLRIAREAGDWAKEVKLVAKVGKAQTKLEAADSLVQRLSA